MAEPGPGGVDLHHTLSVNHDDLEYFANVQLKNFLDQLASDPGYKAMLSFGGIEPGEYTQLYTGFAGSFPLAGSVKAKFAALAKGLASDLKEAGLQMTDAQLEILKAMQIMDSAHEEAITTAEMLQILNKVIASAPPKSA
ncbi:hypothetical protein J5Y04_25645 [Kitasatospora sp. RG8]|uniref:hypothetical protein n=1 Tax=Kitasatospora sp. RG8 TaxID=2820815 RepID=UPI001ADEFEA7|nr:hypothetical protein [Kitasatospora sp. RG8]MBP0452902.1 hypothetical protein [Kitasatospora sp. RG8]